MRKFIIIAILIGVFCVLAGDSISAISTSSFEFPSWLAPVLATLLGLLGVGAVEWWSRAQAFMTKLAGLFKEIYELFDDLARLDPKDADSINAVFSEINDIIAYIKNWKLGDSFKAIEKIEKDIQKTKKLISTKRHG